MRPNPALSRFILAAAGVAALAATLSPPRLPCVSLRVTTPSFHLSVSL